jgi:putative isomerase
MPQTQEVPFAEAPVRRVQIGYDVATYMQRPGVAPCGNIVIGDDNEESLAVTRDYLVANWRKMARPPKGVLKHPYMVPGGTYDNLWDWDSFFASCAVPEDGLEYAIGSIRNFLDNVREDGRPPKMTTPEGALNYTSHPVPLHAQFLYLMAVRKGDFTWAEYYWPILERISNWYDRETRSREGHYVWLGFQGSGIDNNPNVYGRPAKSSAGIDLACWHYREFHALEKLARRLNNGRANFYAEKAAELSRRISWHYWDVIDRFFYNIDCSGDPCQTSLQTVTWEVFLKLRNWASFFPVWAKIATDEQACELRKRALDPDEFLSPAGLRSHSARDPIYNNTATGNPSNWQGPVWGLSTFVTAYGLAKYGYRNEALDLSFRQIRVFAADIRQNGCLHEYYHGDTGQPIMKPGFLSWDILGLLVIDDLRSGTDCTTLDLLD